MLISGKALRSESRMVLALPGTMNEHECKLEELTAFQLLVLLQRAGWKWSAAPSNIATRALLPPVQNPRQDPAESADVAALENNESGPVAAIEYDSNAGGHASPSDTQQTSDGIPNTEMAYLKMFYSPSVHIDDNYLRCLLQVDRLFQNGVRMVRHCQLSEYYVSLLQLEHDGSAVLMEKPKRKPQHRVLTLDVPEDRPTLICTDNNLLSVLEDGTLHIGHGSTAQHTSEVSLRKFVICWSLPVIRSVM